MEDERFWDQLLQLISEHNVVPIVGRDLLRVHFEDQDVLLYPLIARRLADYLSLPSDNLPRGEELNTVACRYMERGHRIEDVYSALKIIMPGEETLSIPEPLKQLASIQPLKLFVTTTFDPLMKRALDQVRFSATPKTQVLSYTPNTIEDITSSLRELDRPVVYHLFGRLSAMPLYAVTEEDTLEFLHMLQSESRQPRLLLDELNRANLLILGCNFGNWLARFFLRSARRQRLLEARGSTDYMVDSAVNADQSLVLFLRHFSARTKIYSGHSASEFINELHQRWNERIPADRSNDIKWNSTADGAHTSGAVFLSYASEDRSAAIRMKDALEREGVDVFFDKHKLQAGDDYEQRLRTAISESSLFVLLISRNTLTEQRRFFRKEWKYALDEAHKVAPTERFILPVVIDDTSPTEQAIPEEIRQLHWEQLPAGTSNNSFTILVKKLFRRYQKSTMVIP